MNAAVVFINAIVFCYKKVYFQIAQILHSLHGNKNIKLFYEWKLYKIIIFAGIMQLPWQSSTTCINAFLQMCLNIKTSDLCFHFHLLICSYPSRLHMTSLSGRKLATQSSVRVLTVITIFSPKCLSRLLKYNNHYKKLLQTC